MSATVCRCDDPAAELYGPDKICWPCWAEQMGDRDFPEPDLPKDDSFLSPPRDMSRGERNTGLPFMPLGQAIGEAPPEPDWAWEGYATPGAVVLIAGRPKVGKSTLLFGLIAAMLAGRSFVGRGTNCKGVLMLTEESADTLAEKARTFGIADHPRLHVLLRRQVQASWLEIIAGARDYCREHELDVLIIDTFDKWTGLRGDDENKSGPVLQAFEPLMLAAGEGLTVVLVTHQRKARGEHGEAVRGSNALTGSVDIIVELERVPDVPRARALIGTSRFASTPEELAIELTDDGYVDRGDVDALRERLDNDKVLDALDEDDWMTTEEIVEATEIANGTVHKRLNELHKEERVDRDGAGKRGSPFKWRILSPQPCSLGGERNETNREDPPEAGLAHADRGREASEDSFSTALSLGGERKNGGPPEAEIRGQTNGRTVADLSDQELLDVFPGLSLEDESKADQPPTRQEER